MRSTLHPPKASPFKRFEGQLAAKGVELQYLVEGIPDRAHKRKLHLIQVVGGPKNGEFFAVWLWPDGDFELFHRSTGILMSADVDLLTSE